LTPWGGVWLGWLVGCVRVCWLGVGCGVTPKQLDAAIPVTDFAYGADSEICQIQNSQLNRS